MESNTVRTSVWLATTHPGFSYQPGLTRVAALDKQLTHRDESLAAVQERLLQAQSMKQSHEDAHQDVSFSVGNWVWLRLHQRAATVIKTGQNAKLASHYYDPFQVLELFRKEGGSVVDAFIGKQYSRKKKEPSSSG
jgi:hypothetical protein